jgi:hyperosmotically inducible protein
MKTGPMTRKLRETLISRILSITVMSGLLVLLIIAGYLFAANKDERIAAAAREAFVSQAYLKGDDIQVHSQDGAVTLLGTVAAEPHLSIAAATVADLPGVKRVDNRLEVRAHAFAGPAPGSAHPAVSGPSLHGVSK